LKIIKRERERERERERKNFLLYFLRVMVFHNPDFRPFGFKGKIIEEFQDLLHKNFIRGMETIKIYSRTVGTVEYKRP